MQNKANGRSAIIIVAGLLALYGGPAAASGGSDSGRIVVAQNDSKSDAKADAAQSSSGKSTARAHRHQRISSRHKAEKVAKSSDKKTSTTTKPADQANIQGDMTPAVANANAQMVGPAPSDGAVKSPADVAQDAAPVSAANQDAATDAAAAGNTDAPVLASDQLNELDRAATGDKAPPRVLRPVAKASYVANTSAEDTWSQTSLIGKVFIAFGGFLTLASAARMFIA